MKSLLARLISSRVLAAERDAAHTTYIALMKQARSPFFYTECGVPDTLDGRFDTLVLHVALLLYRLKREETPAAHSFSRKLAETLVSDYDRTLREMGVSDTGVPRRMKAMMRAFYGRLAAYDAAWNEPAELRATLRRNVYGTLESVPDSRLQRLEEYIMQKREYLENQSSDQLLSGMALS